MLNFWRKFFGKFEEDEIYPSHCCVNLNVFLHFYCFFRIAIDFYTTTFPKSVHPFPLKKKTMNENILMEFRSWIEQ